MRYLINKYFFLIAVVCAYIALAASAQAQTSLEPTPKNISRAEMFFKSCTKDPIFDLSDDTDLAFCACAATNMKAWLDKKEKDTETANMFSRTHDVSEPNSNDYFADIYGPCLYLPISEIAYYDCMAMKKNKFFIKDHPRRKAYCLCMARGESDYFEHYAQPFLQMRIAKEEKIIDPIAEIKQDLGYYHAQNKTETDCYLKFEQRP